MKVTRLPNGSLKPDVRNTRWLIFAPVAILALFAPSANAEPIAGLQTTYYTIDSVPPTRSEHIYTVCGSEVENNINRSYDGEPFENCTVDLFMVHMTGFIEIPEHNTIEFWLASDDGGIIDVGGNEWGNWGDQGCTWMPSGQIDISAGSQPLDLWVYENGGSTCIMLAWNINGQGFEIVPDSAFTTTANPTTTTVPPTTTLPSTTTTVQETTTSWASTTTSTTTTTTTTTTAPSTTVPVTNPSTTTTLQITTTSNLPTTQVSTTTTSTTEPPPTTTTLPQVPNGTSTTSSTSTTTIPETTSTLPPETTMPEPPATVPLPQTTEPATPETVPPPPEIETNPFPQPSPDVVPDPILEVVDTIPLPPEIESFPPDTLELPPEIVDTIIDVVDTMPLPPDTMPEPPDTMPLPPDTLPDAPQPPVTLPPAVIAELPPEVVQALLDAGDSQVPLTEEQFTAVVDTIADLAPEEAVALITQILATAVTPDQATALATNPEVLAVITEEQATEIFATIEVAQLDATQIAELTAAVQAAPTKVRKAFEKTINIFGGFDNYVPTGSKVPVGERRTLIAIAAGTTLTAAGSKIKRK